jgi:glutamate racemase
MLGVFDSGLGGLTVLRRLRALLPHEDLVYFADQRNVPYGDRSDDDLRALLCANVDYLCGQGVDAIVMGCNTSCAIASRYGWPPAEAQIFDLIDAASEAVAASGARRVGVLATAATVRIGAYGTAIRTRCPQIEVRESGAPELVPLVEAGVLSGPRACDAVASACAPLGADLDALVLACTHFPLLERAFDAVFGSATLRIDPAEVQARRAAAWTLDRMPGGTGRRGRTRYVTTREVRFSRRRGRCGRTAAR